MRVKSCVASDGSGHVINLSDEFGCVLRPKMISRFLKARAPDERATVITYAFFHAFKFPDASVCTSSARWRFVATAVSIIARTRAWAVVAADPARAWDWVSAWD